MYGREGRHMAGLGWAKIKEKFCANNWDLNEGQD
jgi:hypothetical protein